MPLTIMAMIYIKFAINTGNVVRVTTKPRIRNNVEMIGFLNTLHLELLLFFVGLNVAE